MTALQPPKSRLTKSENELLMDAIEDTSFPVCRQAFVQMAETFQEQCQNADVITRMQFYLTFRIFYTQLFS